MRTDQLAIQRKVGDSLSQIIVRTTGMKQIEVEMAGFRSELEEHLVRQQEEISILKSQVKAQKFEIETDLMRKVKLHQSQSDNRLEEFYKFKADVYSYLDGKYETLAETHGSRLKSLGEFADSTEVRLRQLMDIKVNNEKLVEESLGRYHHKIQGLEAEIKRLSSKTAVVESSQ